MVWLLHWEVVEQGYLQTYNHICQAVFNPEWVERQLTQLLPYANLLDAWGASNYQDEALLLQGRALKDAQAWAEGKNLSKQDYHFFAASSLSVLFWEVGRACDARPTYLPKQHTPQNKHDKLLVWNEKIVACRMR